MEMPRKEAERDEGEDESADSEADTQEGEATPAKKAPTKPGQRAPPQLARRADHRLQAITSRFEETSRPVSCATRRSSPVEPTSTRDDQPWRGGVSSGQSLQRRLMAQQARSWDFDQEEDCLDAARLARVIVTRPFA